MIEAAYASETFLLCASNLFGIWCLRIGALLPPGGRAPQTPLRLSSPRTRSLQMVKTASTMATLGSQAPDFSLLNVDGRTVSLEDFAGKKGLLVIFMCNHCPFVRHVAGELTRLANDYLPKGLAIV